jgi:CubicO group peptidase (beta-lactamase class C family)
MTGASHDTPVKSLEAFADADAARLRTAAAEALRELRPAGFSVGVVSGRDLVFAEGFGFADIESGLAQHPRLRQRIGSITKTMVGLCLAALADEGRLTLDDRLIDHIAEVELHGDGAAIRLRHLLTHTSGIGEVAMPEQMLDAGPTLWSDAPDEDLLGLFPQGVTLEIPPATKWSYANLGFALLGEVVARAEGAPIADVLARRIFGPLGMADSDLADRPSGSARRSRTRPPSTGSTSVGASSTSAAAARLARCNRPSTTWPATPPRCSGKAVASSGPRRSRR